MASESRLISSKAVSAIHSDLGVFSFFFGPSIPRPSLISLPPFCFFFFFSTFLFLRWFRSVREGGTMNK